MADFSLTHPLNGFFAPTRCEADVIDCMVTGTIPPELDGAFYRMHGDWLFAPESKMNRACRPTAISACSASAAGPSIIAAAM